MLTKLSLKAKLLALTISLALCLFIVGGVGIWSLRTVTKEYNTIAQVNLPNVTNVALMRASISDMVRNYLRLGIPGTKEAELERNKRQFEEAIARYDAAEKKYLSVDFMPGEEVLYKAEKAAFDVFLRQAKEAVDDFFSDASEGKKKYIELVQKELVESRGAVEAKVSELIAYHGEAAKTTTKDAENVAKFGNTLSIVLSIVGFAFALLVGYFFSTSLSKTLNEIAQRLSSGADEVASASQQISSTSEELSASATEQAASLQETAASIEEMSAMVNKNADNANRSRDVSGTSSVSAQKGKQVVGDMIRAIEEINQSNGEIMKQIETSNNEISDIVKVIAEIGNKTKVINDIVFQTKLLSFNASVEAARAGEHGKGFAVVAEEVGNLAQMSGNAAKEISGMLEGSIQKVENIVTDTKTKVQRLVEVGKEKVESGTVVAKNCGEVLDEIVKSVGEVNHMVSEISTASQEQAQGVQEITRAISQLDQVTQQNAAASEQSASASEELSAQAEILRTMVQNLMQTVQGGDGVVVAHSTKPAPRAKKPAPTGAGEKGGEGKVVQMKPAPRKQVEAKTKRAVGAENVPAENDARFKDV